MEENKIFIERLNTLFNDCEIKYEKIVNRKNEKNCSEFIRLETESGKVTYRNITGMTKARVMSELAKMFEADSKIYSMDKQLHDDLLRQGTIRWLLIQKQST